MTTVAEETSGRNGDENRALGVYVHWPYCARICPYCDFNVYKNRDVDAGLWTRSLVKDLEYWAGRTPNRRLASLYFGGGSPSLAPPETVEAVINAAARLWGFEDDPEITLEANPTDAERERFRAFAAAGVNRLSLGVQSLRDEALRFLGRNHDAAEARQAIDAAMTHFPRMTFDMIYARPSQSIDAWREELGEALAVGASHLSLYQLSIEENTAFEKAVARGDWVRPDDDLCADLYDATQETMIRAGLPAYEVSNHAAPGDESRHNMIYWRQHDYVGVGPGAHGRLTIDGARIATLAYKKPDDYLAAAATGGGGAAEETTLSATARAVEALSMGLRTSEGVRLTPFLEAELAKRQSRLKALMDEAMLIERDGRLIASDAARRVLDSVTGYLLA